MGKNYVSMQKKTPSILLKNKKRLGKTESVAAQKGRRQEWSEMAKQRERMSERKTVVIGSRWCQEAPLRPNIHSHY